MRSQSMPRFARMVGESMRNMGHEVDYWAPQDRCHARFKGTRLEKWAGYVDQYVLFPLEVKRRLKHASADTFVRVLRPGLGPWVLGQTSAARGTCARSVGATIGPGAHSQNPTSWSWRLYQRYIRWGFSQARHFIAVSTRTERELRSFGQAQPETSTVVFNGLNYPYQPMARGEALAVLQQAGLEGRSIAHSACGGDQWYKTRLVSFGCMPAMQSARPRPRRCGWSVLSPVGPMCWPPCKLLPPRQVRFCQGIDKTKPLQAAYSVAGALLFPSLAEGFGWPVVEARRLVVARYHHG